MSTKIVQQHLQQIQNIESFFPKKILKRGAENTLTAADPKDSTAFTSGDSGCNGIMQLGEKITGDLSPLSSQLNTYLGDFSGLCSSHMRSLNDNDKLFDPDLWLESFRHLPLISYGNLENTEMSERVRGVEIATKFLSTVVGFATTGGAALVGFQKFLESMGDQIRLGTSKSSNKYNVCMVATGVTMGNDGRLVANIKGFFLDYEQSKKVVSSNCASYDEYDMSFKYRRIDGVLNYSFLDKGHEDVKKQLDQLLNKSQIDDIAASFNFFGANALEPSKTKELEEA